MMSRPNDESRNDERPHDENPDNENPHEEGREKTAANMQSGVYKNV